MPFFTFLMPFVIAVATCFIFRIWWLSRIRKGAEIEVIVKRLRTEIADLITELNSTTDRNIVLLEDRIRELNKLLERAVKIQKVLDKEKEKDNNASRIYTELGKVAAMPVQEVEPKPEPERIAFASLSARDKILVLHRRGESLDIIAEKTGSSRGEVELVVALYDKGPIG